MSEAVVDGIQAEGEEEPEMGIRIVDLVAKEWAEDEITENKEKAHPRPPCNFFFLRNKTFLNANVK